MSDESLKVLSKASQDAGGMYWACTACTSYSAKFNKSIQELDRRVSRLEEQMREQEVEFEEVRKDVDSVKRQDDRDILQSSRGAGEPHHLCLQGAPGAGE